jgi:hypothetical protein
MLGRGSGATRYGHPFSSYRRSRRGLNHALGGYLQGGPVHRRCISRIILFYSCIYDLLIHGRSLSCHRIIRNLLHRSLPLCRSLEAMATSYVAPDVLGAVVGDAAADEPGSDTETAVGAYRPVDGAPPTGRPSPWSNLLLLYKVWLSSNDTLSSPWTGVTALPFLLLVSGPALGTIGPPAISIPGICTPQDSSPFCHATIPILSRVGTSSSSLLLVTWLEHKGVLPIGGVVKLTEDRSGLCFTSRVLCTSGAKLELLRDRRVMSPLASGSTCPG